MSNDLLKGKRGLVLGLANQHSIAWGIAKSAAQAGAELGFTYQSEPLKKRVEPLAQQLGGVVFGVLDVASPDSLDQLFENVKQRWGQIDFLIHAIGFSDKNELTGRYLDTSLNNFLNTMNISVYSLTAIVQRAEKPTK